MVTAKCTRCLGSATGDSFDEASKKINHAVGLSRGIPCGDNYNCVEEVKEAFSKQSPKETIKESGQDETYSKVEGKSTDKVEFTKPKVFGDLKPSTAKKSKSTK